MTKLLNWLLKIFLFLLPWQTIYIYREGFLNNAKWQYGTLGFYGTEILLWLIVILFIVWLIPQIKQHRKENKFHFGTDRLLVLSVLLFILYCLLSTTWALDADLALQYSLYVIEAFLLFFMLLTGPVSWREIIKWLTAGAVLTALFGIGQFIWQGTFAFKWLGLAEHLGWQAGASVVAGEGVGRLLRAYGSFSHPNVFAGYLVMTIITWLFFGYKIIQEKKYIWLLVYSILLLAVLLSFSRAGWLALSIGLLVYWFVGWRSQNKQTTVYHIILTVLLVAVFGAALFPALQTRIMGASALEIRSVEERTAGVSEALTLWSGNKWLGVGPGNYTLAAYELDPSRSGSSYQPVHNVLLLLLTELGIVGLLLFLFVIAFFINYQIANSRRRYTADNNFSIRTSRLVGYLLFVTCYLLLGLFDHYLYSSYVGLIASAVYWSVITRFHTQPLHS